MFSFHRQTRVTVNRQGVVGRRDFLKCVSASALAAGTVTWTDLVAASADDLRRRGRACILLWMQGGPSQFETLDPKPGHANGGATEAIDTTVSGIRIAANFPNLAKQMKHAAILRSLTSKEGNHQRATFLMHTGYAPTASVKHPALGSIVARELGRPECELPAFVRIGGDIRQRNSGNGGFLGVEYDPFAIREAGKLPENAAPTTEVTRYRRRLDLLEKLEADYAKGDGSQRVVDHRKLYEKTSRMILSKDMRAFDLEREPAAVREAYGSTPFASGCLLARRLVESGVPFVEVQLNGWDTHDNNFDRVKQLSGQVDQPVANLLADLDARGILERTLVIWMGEFGRTPKINPRNGRDHYPRAFSALLAGGGVRGGQVVGSTTAGGDEVAERPILVTDFFQTLCRSLEIDPAKENMTPIGRPIKIVDGGQPVSELFG
ncbi:MAG: DUF1501 domain-containing protein [Pirellulales bacterium]|nr:DUF1501 domain-containing protein [Pirellulales bacterium]